MSYVAYVYIDNICICIYIKVTLATSNSSYNYYTMKNA